ncbi:class I SAM-dependent methyltransferase [Thiomicrorhabdus arctica]|jgi:16S rRNA (guanine1516-N2)-methyltransferase|uniref:class I SAM-dependent methyltransferase n=1 Tax=Thiomicrorhabdus arctica TaxID=131540 RepID=UPI000372CAC4|nr:class I SAM-dependent methyltransferase [Thiomicrorhabdus arctica]
MSETSTSASHAIASLAISHLTEPKAAQLLSERFNLPIDLQHSADMTLGWHWVKKDPIPKLALFYQDSGPVFIDFGSGKKAHRRHFGGGKGQPLVRAMGKLKEGLPTVLDATAGMGGDSFVIASQGFKVQMIERSVAVAALLEDGLKRVQDSLRCLSDKESDPELLGIIMNMSLLQADATDYLLSQKPVVDVIYMDPMYPEKKKNAATKKEMKALQNLVGPDRDSENLLQAALQTASYRVVVKRPKSAPILQLNNPRLTPSAEISSPNTRYDIYSIKALKASGLL